MHTYETLFITSPTLTEEEERAAVEKFAQIVSDGGGSFVANERMGRRRLAYPIRKHQDGVYVRFLYDSEAAVPKELERRFKIADEVLRALTVRLEDNWAAAAKEQEVRDAQARAEAAERERKEREEHEAAEKAKAEAEAAAAAEVPESGDVEPAATEAEAVPEETEPAAEEETS